MSSISVVIPTYHRYESLEQTIKDLLSQSRAPDQIIVVDNSALNERQKPDFLTNTPTTECIYISSSKVGKVNTARNEGLAKVTSTFVLYFDDDMSVPKECIENFLMVHNEGWDAVIGTIYEKGVMLDAQDIQPNRPLWSILRTQHGDDKGITIGVPSGFVSVRTTKLFEIGGFDEAYIYNYDDYDLGLRLWKNGTPVVRDPRIKINHLKVPSGGGRVNTQSQRRLNKFTAKYYFLFKHFNNRATKFEFLTDIIFSFTDYKFRPLTLISELKAIVGAFRQYRKYNHSGNKTSVKESNFANELEINRELNKAEHL